MQHQHTWAKADPIKRHLYRCTDCNQIGNLMTFGRAPRVTDNAEQRQSRLARCIKPMVCWMCKAPAVCQVWRGMQQESSCDHCKDTPQRRTA